MLALHLPAEVEARLGALAKTNGKPRHFMPASGVRVIDSETFRGIALHAASVSMAAGGRLTGQVASWLSQFTRVCQIIKSMTLTPLVDKAGV